jgi:glycosyltransferase involved in cell wall biosynthesis
VVEGGSTDGTIDILKSFSTSRPFRWVTGKDEGMYDAINKGLSLAQGEVLGYLNSDDLYLPWSVETAVQKLAECADLVYGDLGVLQVIGESKSGFFLQFYRPFNLRYYTHIASIGQPTVFWRRSITDEIGGFDTGYKLIGDCDYWLRTAVAGKKLSHVHEVLAIQVDHGEALRFAQHDRLAEEFGKMRTHYSEFAGPPRRKRFGAYEKSLRWRFGSWMFLLTAAKRRPKRWPRFITFLRRHEVRINRLATLVLFTLPGRLRPSEATWVDTARFQRALRDEIGAPDIGTLDRLSPGRE